MNLQAAAALSAVGNVNAAGSVNNAQDAPLQRPAPKEQEKEKSIDFKEYEATLPGHNKAAADLQQISLAINRKLRFVVDQESREIFIKVIDSETDKVIKILPPAELQRLHNRVRETLGFLFDEFM